MWENSPVHRKKYEEGVLDVQFSQQHNIVVSAGADGIVKIYDPLER